MGYSGRVPGSYLVSHVYVFSHCDPWEESHKDVSAAKKRPLLRSFVPGASVATRPDTAFRAVTEI